MVYASIWDWRVNHIPLNRAVPFTAGQAELEHAVFTRQVGWGVAGAHLAGEKNAIGYGSHGGLGNGPVAHNGYGHGHTSSPSRKPIGNNGHHVRTGSDNMV
jgi:hypothetical protein